MSLGKKTAGPDDRPTLLKMEPMPILSKRPLRLIASKVLVRNLRTNFATITPTIRMMRAMVTFGMRSIMSSPNSEKESLTRSRIPLSSFSWSSFGMLIFCARIARCWYMVVVYAL